MKTGRTNWRSPSAPGTNRRDDDEEGQVDRTRCVHPFLYLLLILMLPFTLLSRYHFAPLTHSSYYLPFLPSCASGYKEKFGDLSMA